MSTGQIYCISLNSHHNHIIFYAMYQSSDSINEITQLKQQYTTTTTTIHRHVSKIHSVRCNSNNTILATASHDKTINLYDITHTNNTFIHITQLQVHTNSVECICWNYNNEKMFISGSSDKTVRLYDLTQSNTKSIYTISTPGENILLSWSTDSRYIVIGDKKNYITLIDYNMLSSSHNSDGNKHAIITTKQYTNEINDIQLIYSNLLQSHILLCATDVGTIDIYKYNDLSTCIYSHHCHSTAIYSCTYNLHGNILASGGADSLVQLWSLQSMNNICTYSRCESSISCISISTNNKLIAIGSEDKRIDISYLSNGTHIYTINTLADIDSIQFIYNNKLDQYTIIYSEDELNRNNIGKLYCVQFTHNDTSKT